jgi:hypothetical protein
VEVSVFGRLSFFAAGLSPRHIGGGRSSAMAVEWRCVIGMKSKMLDGSCLIGWAGHGWLD